MKKTDDEILGYIRQAALAIDDIWPETFPVGGNVNLGGLEKVESYGNALATYCKLLRQRLEAGQPTLTEGE